MLKEHGYHICYDETAPLSNTNGGIHIETEELVFFHAELNNVS
jgi:hypothetical protein